MHFRTIYCAPPKRIINPHLCKINEKQGEQEEQVKGKEKQIGEGDRYYFGLLGMQACAFYVISPNRVPRWQVRVGP